jgi:hypothetical protein
LWITVSQRTSIDPLHWRHKSLECPPDAP